MQQELELLLKKLDRKEAVNWVEEMRLGKPAYEYLVLCLNSGELTKHQRRNLLHAIFRLRSHGSDEEVFALLLKHARHAEKQVRSEAAMLIVGMMKLHECRSPFNLAAGLDELRAGIELGLTHDTNLLVRDFIRATDDSIPVR